MQPTGQDRSSESESAAAGRCGRTVLKARRERLDVQRRRALYGILIGCTICAVAFGLLGRNLVVKVRKPEPYRPMFVGRISPQTYRPEEVMHRERVHRLLRFSA
ncbi:MAG: hypothetical protein U1E27_13315, partial [Kiritimatiellia bacterium]|nr:hypothetical protein [Kiritimatiellia bacterium]